MEHTGIRETNGLVIPDPKEKLARREGCDERRAQDVLSVQNANPKKLLVSMAALPVPDCLTMVSSFVKAKVNVCTVLERQVRDFISKKPILCAATLANSYSVFRVPFRPTSSTRMGFGCTRAEARQLVSHCAVTVNVKKVNIPSLPSSCRRCYRYSRKSQNPNPYQ